MDANTWNAYHIVSNRARAVCYAARQQQFRVSTELAVNRLAGEAFRQLERMRQLEGSQHQLQQLTGDTMEKVARGQEELLSKNDQLRSAQASIKTRVVDNLRELTRVRSAISVGQAGVAHTLEEIRSGLERAGAELKLQESARNRSHQELTQDLERIHDSATQLLHRLESVGKRLRRGDGLRGDVQRESVRVLWFYLDTMWNLGRQFGIRFFINGLGRLQINKKKCQFAFSSAVAPY